MSLDPCRRLDKQHSSLLWTMGESISAAVWCTHFLMEFQCFLCLSLDLNPDGTAHVDLNPFNIFADRAQVHVRDSPPLVAVTTFIFCTRLRRRAPISLRRFRALATATRSFEAEWTSLLPWPTRGPTILARPTEWMSHLIPTLSSSKP